MRVRVLVTSAAFTDVMIRKGMYPDVKEKPSFTPGYDMVGLVDAMDTGAKPLEADTPEATVLNATKGGVDAVFYPLGGDYLSRSLHALNPGGMLVAFGFQNEVLGRGGSILIDFVKLKLWDWLPNGHATAFYSIGAMRRKHPEWFRKVLAAFFSMLADGRISPVVAETLLLDQVRRAHERVETGNENGKLVLRVTER